MSPRLSFVLLLSAIFVNLVTSAPAETITSDTLTKLLESLKSYLSPHQPVPDYVYSINNSFISANASINESYIFDPTNYKVENVSVNMNNLIFMATLTFPELLATGKYTDVIDNDLIRLAGGGNYNVNLTNFDAQLNVSLKLNEEDTLEMNDFIVDYNVGSIKMLFDNITGDKNSSDALNKMFNEEALDYLVEIKPVVQSAIKDLIASYSSFILYGMNVSQFIDYINGFASNLV